MIVYEFGAKGIGEVDGDDVDAFGTCCATRSALAWASQTIMTYSWRRLSGLKEDVDGEATQNGDVEQGQLGGHSGHCDA